MLTGVQGVQGVVFFRSGQGRVLQDWYSCNHKIPREHITAPAVVARHIYSKVNPQHPSKGADHHKSFKAIIKHDKLRQTFMVYFPSMIMYRTMAFEIPCSD